jgi:hypothetical protein
MTSDAADSLLELLVQLLRHETIERRRLSYRELRGATKRVVDDTLNPGIPLDQAEFVTVEVEADSLLIAFYRSDEDDFTAAYGFRNDVVVHKYEN